jgi:hypothetical protein
MWNKAKDPEEAFRDKAIWWSAGIVIAAAIAIGVYYRFYSPVPKVPQQASAPTQPAPSANTPPAIQHPIPTPATQAAAPPLPSLDKSDPLVRGSLIGLMGKQAVARFLVPQSIVRHVVVTVDNLPRKKLAAELRPIQPTPGGTIVDHQGGITTLSAQNYARYTPFVDAVSAIDPQALAALYFRLYPLFQQAYENLGYPGKYFNDRVVQAIDSLLATPDVRGPIALVRPKVFYQFADPKLEALPAGQKLLIRMGPQNAAVIEQKLRAFRQAIVNPPPSASQPAARALPDASSSAHAAPESPPGKPPPQ